ncbi:DUF1758 domain-containing protein [Trichonephila clavipes]|nr:DUF1758 domain-containing protein [Trichonephila clavipes]
MALQAQSQIESNELTLSKLKRKRGTLRGVVTKQISKLESDILIPDIAVEDLEESFQLLTERGEELKLIDFQIESLIEIDGIEAEFDIVEEYREKIMRTRFKVKLIQEIKESSTDNSWHNFNVSLNSSSLNEKERIKLPKLIIPKFYGEISDWLYFWNSFISAIHENDYVCKIDKFNYLRSFWGGSAFNLIDGLELTEEHYDHSIDILKQKIWG